MIGLGVARVDDVDRHPLVEGGPVTNHDGVLDDPNVVQNVFADGVGAGPGLGDGVETALSGYQVSTAALAITKAVSVVWDPFNEFDEPKAIPGAILEYSITVENTGTQDADAIVITDDVDALTDFVVDAYGPNQDVEYDTGGAPSYCDATDGNATDCDFADPTLTVGGAGLVLTVAPTETLTVSFQVQIPAL